jgi:hypothetical protein
MEQTYLLIAAVIILAFLMMNYKKEPFNTRRGVAPPTRSAQVKAPAVQWQKWGCGTDFDRSGKRFYAPQRNDVSNKMSQCLAIGNNCIWGKEHNKTYKTCMNLVNNLNANKYPKFLGSQSNPHTIRTDTKAGTWLAPAKREYLRTQRIVKRT